MSDLVVRAANPGDLPAVLDLLRAAMHRGDDERFDALFRWKHLDNAFGPSPAWVAVDGERIAAVRYLMRWEFERGSRVYRAVRAVDTATHPDYQGRGLFTKLTMGALADLEAEGVDFVFNTPNDQSRPGYLKMGWVLLGTLAVPSRPLTPLGATRMLRARVPAEHFSIDVRCAESAADVLADGIAVDRLLAARGPSDRFRTRASIDFLRWRFGGSLLQYRAVTDRRGVADGVAIFRIRRRGPATEAALVWVASAHGEAGKRRLVRSAMRAARHDADYMVAIGDRPLATFVPVPGAGPTLTWRAVCDRQEPMLTDFEVGLGDIELF